MTIVTKKISDTFEKALFTMPMRFQAHWSLRKWRISKDSRYLVPIIADFQLKTLNYFLKINKVTSIEEARKVGYEMLLKYGNSSEKQQLRKPVYEKNTELIYLLQAIHYLFMAKVYGFDEESSYKKLFETFKRLIEEYDFSLVVKNSELVRVNPSSVANSVYYLQYLGFGDFEDLLLDTFKNSWLEFNPQTPLEWRHKVYAFTHIFIAASYFYQREIDPQKFSWILDYFEKNFEIIAKNTNPDIVAEVGVSFKLCGQKSSPIVQKAKKVVEEAYDEKQGYIPREGQGQEKAEHRNILAVMLMEEYEKLYEGPNLYNLVKAGDFRFYIPKEDFSEA